MKLELLAETERQRLTRRERIDLGTYHSWNPAKEYRFVVEIDAGRLARLIDQAAKGSHVYELMAIRRAGDVLPYLTVRVLELDPATMTSLLGRIPDYRREADDGLPFLEFDGCFQWDFDDAPPHAQVWLGYRQAVSWHDRMTGLLDIVRAVQPCLRQHDDYLLQHELRLMEAGRHRRDLWPDWRIEPHPLPIPHDLDKPAPAAIRGLILELVKREDIRSVSCPFPDYELWRGLVAEQVKRAQATGLPLQQAFCLCGPDSGPGEATVEDWGGEVHIPYEGACGGDLFIIPGWFNFASEKIKEGGKLRWATWGRGCNHVLVRGDHGEVACATRTPIGEWTLYSSTEPYVDCNPFFGEEAQRINEAIRQAREAEDGASTAGERD